MSQFLDDAASAFDALSQTRSRAGAVRLPRETRNRLRAYSAEEREQIAELLDTLRARPAEMRAAR